MMDSNDSLLRGAYLALAALAGSITALSVRNWKEMTRSEILLTLFVGFSFAWFVTPWLAHSVLGVAEDGLRKISALTYIFAAGTNSILPMLIRSIQRAVERVFGSEVS